ncbi:MAG: succinate dehydrogenase cytochrome b subunit [Bacteroidetes bacterium]|nr:succinate dehydrogenase cytochrome b subunit [Bacteroidota bacterium]
MSKKTGFLSSSIGKKFLMGLTGLFLISFLVIHVSLNSFIFFNDGGASFNAGADFMAHNPVIRILEIGLFAGLLLHIFQALLLTLENRKARPTPYEVVNGGANSSWYSRSMGVLGSLLLLFLVVHLGNFWVPTKIAVFSHEEHNTFASMKLVFAKWYFVAIYLVGVISLLYHLLHGFQSAFQSLGLNHKKYTPLIKKTGIWFSIIVCTLFAAMPVTMFLGIIK